MAGEWKQIGGECEWKNTQACVGQAGALYAISSGVPYRIYTHDGSWVKVGESSGWAPRFLLGGLAKLYSLEESGTVFEIDPFTGAYVKVSEDGQWGSTLSATTVRDSVITCDQDGSLYRYMPRRRTHEKLPVAGTWRSRLLAATNGGLFTNDNALVTVEESGSMYAVDLATNQYGQVDGDWAGTRTLVGCGHLVYAFTEAGFLYAIDPRAHTWSQVGETSTWKSRIACTVGGRVYTLEESGTFYEVVV